MLEHARDAGGVSRRDIRALAGPLLDQTVLWPMIVSDWDDSLPIDDIPLIGDFSISFGWNNRLHSLLFNLGNDVI